MTRRDMLIDRTTDWFLNREFDDARPEFRRVFTEDPQTNEPWPGGDTDPYGRLGIRWPLWDPATEKVLLVANVAQIVEVAEPWITDEEWEMYLDALSVRQQFATALSGGCPNEELGTLPPTIDGVMEDQFPHLWWLIARVETMTRV